ncbi:MAG: hypothetical protein FJ216_10395 [Ignavibacteria bacterium]|nr:hypothetical protein [Ignavibacteria bacterium]
MNNGYIALHRKIIDNSIYKDSKLLHLFLHLLLKASHKDQKIIFNNSEITIRRGQCVAGRKQLSKEIGVNENYIYRKLRILENLNVISLRPNNKFTVVTIDNYSIYQTGEIKSNNKRTTRINELGKNRTTKKDFKDFKNKGVITESLERVNNKRTAKQGKLNTYNNNIYILSSKEKDRLYIYSVVQLLLRYTNKEKSYCYAIINKLLKYKAADNDISKLQKCLMLMYIVKKYCDKINDPKYIGILTNSYRELSYTDFKRIVFEQSGISDLFESKNLYSLT